MPYSHLQKAVDCVIKKDLGIGDNAGKHQGMGTPAFRTSEAAYAETELSVTDFNGTAVGTMPGETGTASLNAYDYLFDIQNVSMTIIQPRLENISTFTCTKQELLD